jgi:hypothetical protein
MNSVLSGLTGKRYFVYLDDIVIYAKSLADHNIKPTKGAAGEVRISPKSKLPKPSYN